MKIALIAITKHGAELAKKLGAHLSADLYINMKPIKILTKNLWSKYDAFIYFVSLGAVIRTIAPYLKDKHLDPAIVVVDEKANFAISVLSGHVGGANELAKKIANILGATAVITTASDVNKTISVDTLGKEFGWVIEADHNLTKVSAAVVNEEPIAIVQETGERNWFNSLAGNIHQVKLNEALHENFSAILIITDRVIDNKGLMDKTVFYRPKSLVLGIGSDRGVALRQIEDFVFETMDRFKLSFKSVRNVATIDIKQRESGIKKFCSKYGLELACYTSSELRDIVVPNPSAMVEKYTGIPGVAEAAAIKSSGGTLIVPKQKGKKITLAIARRNYEG